MVRRGIGRWRETGRRRGGCFHWPRAGVAIIIQGVGFDEMGMGPGRSDDDGFFCSSPPTDPIKQMRLSSGVRAQKINSFVSLYWASQAAMLRLHLALAAPEGGGRRDSRLPGRGWPAWGLLRRDDREEERCQKNGAGDT